MSYIYTTQAIVLKKIPAGEADAIVLLYTRDFGKLRAYAQGVKKESAKLKGHIESLSLISVQFVTGVSGERLTYAQMLEPWPSVRGDFNRCAAALYIAELVDRHCLVSQPDAGIWELLMGSFVELDRKEMPACNEIMELFEREFLVSLGYGAHADMRTLGPALARPSVMVYNNK